MYNKKYRCSEIERPNNRDNPCHNMIVGSVCYLVYFSIGEIGLFLYEAEDLYEPVHRVRTSLVEDVEYTDSQVIVTTKNTKYVFDLIV